MSEPAGFQPGFAVNETRIKTVISDRSFFRRYAQIQLQVISVLLTYFLLTMQRSDELFSSSTAPVIAALNGTPSWPRFAVSAFSHGTYTDENTFGLTTADIFYKIFLIFFLSFLFFPSISSLFSFFVCWAPILSFLVRDRTPCVSATISIGENN